MQKRIIFDKPEIIDPNADLPKTSGGIILPDTVSQISTETSSRVILPSAKDIADLKTSLPAGENDTLEEEKTRKSNLWRKLTLQPQNEGEGDMEHFVRSLLMCLEKTKEFGISKEKLLKLVKNSDPLYILEKKDIMSETSNILKKCVMSLSKDKVHEFQKSMGNFYMDCQEHFLEGNCSGLQKLYYFLHFIFTFFRFLTSINKVDINPDIYLDILSKIENGKFPPSPELRKVYELCKVMLLRDADKFSEETAIIIIQKLNNQNDLNSNLAKLLLFKFPNLLQNKHLRQIKEFNQEKNDEYWLGISTDELVTDKQNKRSAGKIISSRADFDSKFGMELEFSSIYYDYVETSARLSSSLRGNQIADRKTISQDLAVLEIRTGNDARPDQAVNFSECKNDLSKLAQTMNLTPDLLFPASVHLNFDLPTDENFDYRYQLFERGVKPNLVEIRNLPSPAANSLHNILDTSTTEDQIVIIGSLYKISQDELLDAYGKVILGNIDKVFENDLDSLNARILIEVAKSKKRGDLIPRILRCLDRKAVPTTYIFGYISDTMESEIDYAKFKKILLDNRTAGQMEGFKFPIWSLPNPDATEILLNPTVSLDTKISIIEKLRASGEDDLNNISDKNFIHLLEQLSARNDVESLRSLMYRLKISNIDLSVNDNVKSLFESNLHPFILEQIIGKITRFKIDALSDTYILDFLSREGAPEAIKLDLLLKLLNYELNTNNYKLISGLLSGNLSNELKKVIIYRMEDLSMKNLNLQNFLLDSQIPLSTKKIILLKIGTVDIKDLHKYLTIFSKDDEVSDFIIEGLYRTALIPSDDISKGLIDILSDEKISNTIVSKILKRASIKYYADNKKTYQEMKKLCEKRGIRIEEWGK